MSRHTLSPLIVFLARGAAGVVFFSSLAAQEPPSNENGYPTVILDSYTVQAEDESSHEYDPTGLDGDRAERNEPPFANELLSDAVFNEIPLFELDQELEALAGARANAADVAAGSESINLRGFPAPLRRNGFSQAGIPEVLNASGSELIIGSLVPVLGRAAPGGIRNVQTTRPKGKTSRELVVSANTLGNRRAEARATGVITPKKSWYLTSATLSGSEGPQRFSESTQFNARAAVAIKHSRATSTLWSFDVLDLQANPAPGIPEYRLTPGSPIIGPYLPLAKFHTYGPNTSVSRQAASLGFQLETQLQPDLSLSSSTQFFIRRSEQDSFTTGQFVESTGVFSGVREPFHREGDFQGLTHQTDLTQRFQAFGAEHKVQGGVEFTYADDRDENRGLLAADRDTLLPASVRTFDPFNPDYSLPDYSPAVYRRIINDRQNLFFYSAGVANLRSAYNRGRTVFTAGVRREYNQITVDDLRASAAFPRSEKNLANTSFHAGLNQRVGQRVLLFTTASSAIQPSTRVDSRTGRIQDNAATSGIELGARASLLERKLTVQFMAFDYTNTDIVRRNPLYQDPVADASQTQPQLLTSGEEKFRGLTSQFAYKPDKAWTFTGRAAYTDAYTVSSPDLPEEVGRTLAQLPRFSAASGVRHSFQSSLLKGLSTGLNATYIGSVVQNYARPGREELSYPDYTTANLNSSYSWTSGKLRHTVSAGINNLLDTDLLAKIARVGAERSFNASWQVVF